MLLHNERFTYKACSCCCFTEQSSLQICTLEIEVAVVLLLTNYFIEVTMEGYIYIGIMKTSEARALYPIHGG